MKYYLEFLVCSNQQPRKNNLADSWNLSVITVSALETSVSLKKCKMVSVFT